MKDITILSSISPITVLDQASPETIEYLGKLITNPKFYSFVELLRKQHRLPNKGLNIKEFEGHNFLDLPYVNNDFVLLGLRIIAEDLRVKLGIGDDFLQQLVLLIFFNAIIDVKYYERFLTKPIEFVLGKEKIASEMFEYPYEIGAILIPYNINQTGLIKWIKENYANIQKQMDENLTTNPYVLKLHKNTELAIEITEMKERQHKSFPQIATDLYNLHPEDDRTADVDWVKKTYSDFHQGVDSLKQQSENK